MDQFIFRLFDTVWEAIRSVFQKKKTQRSKEKQSKE